MDKLRVGIIGCGNISAAYLRLSPLFAPIELIAVADLNRAAAEGRAEEFGVEARAVDALLGADDIDAIVNLTNPEAHFAVTRSILEAGKHAYSEKPIVLTMEEGETLRTLAAERDLRVGSAPDTFLGGAHQLARRLIDEGKVGQVHAGTAHVMSRGMEHWHPNPDFFFKPGAGPMLDLGPYYVTNLVQLLGPVTRVGALTTSAYKERTITSEPRAGETIPVETPTNIHGLLEFANGASVTISTSWDVHAHRHGPMELYGTEGSLFLADPNFFGGQVEFGAPGGDVSEVEAWDHPFSVPNQEEVIANYRVAGLADMAAGLAEGRPHRCSLELALHTVDVMTSVLKSGETGGFVTLSTTCERPEPLGPDAARALLAS